MPGLRVRSPLPLTVLELGLLLTAISPAVHVRKGALKVLRSHSLDPSY